MGKSSVPSAGDGLAFAADIIKLLAPVLKHTNQGKIDSLKTKSRSVQDVFRRMLDGESPVRNYAVEKTAYITHVNKSCIAFHPNVTFEVTTCIQNPEWDLCVVVLAVNNITGECVPEFRIEFEKLMPPILGSFASLDSLWLHRFSTEDLFTNAQDQLIAERGSLTFLPPDETGPYAVEIRCGTFHDVTEIDYKLLSKLVRLT